MLLLTMLVALNTADAGKTMSVDEVVTIEAPAEVVWAYVSDFTTWKHWTVWNVEKDPGAVWSYAGDKGQVGHSSEWAGKELGKGKMVATIAEPNASWQYDLYFGGKDKSYPGGLTLKEADGMTTVVWSWNMEMGAIGAALFGKKIGEMVSKDFAGGLANLEVVAEEAHAKALAAQAAADQAAKEQAAAEQAAAAEEATAPADGAPPAE